MARVRFLAPAADPRPGQEGIVYGPQHETDFSDEDIEYVKSLWVDGKVEILDSTGLTPPATQAAPQTETETDREKRAKT
jgi:hypothetical protein